CEYFSKVMIDESLYDNFNYLEQIALKASKAAGGSEYLDFYKMLLGI
ncbi:MAG: hypothetical protein GY756_00110, partial [bacterium]|nr:hypothetical protein [bacterium]